MKSRIHLRGVKLAWAVCAIQGLISLSAALIVMFYVDAQAAKAALYGGCVAILPTLYLALRVYFRGEDRRPEDVPGSFYRGEAGKFVLTALMFLFGVQFFGEHFLPLLCTYMACIAAFPVVMLTARID